MTGKDKESQLVSGFNALQHAIHTGEVVEATFDSNDVKNPPHYLQGAYETIDEMIIVFGLEATITYCRMCAWKYRARAPYKDDFFKDQAKADWYLNKACELLSEM